MSSTLAIQNARELLETKIGNTSRDLNIENLICELENCSKSYKQLPVPTATLQRSLSNPRQKAKPFLDNDSYNVSNVM